MLNEQPSPEVPARTCEREADLRTVLLRLLRLVAAEIAKDLRVPPDLAPSRNGEIAQPTSERWRPAQPPRTADPLDK
jgi:hypothetical protein